MILDFGLREKNMKKGYCVRWLHFISDNLKSKIQNLKWLGEGRSVGDG